MVELMVELTVHSQRLTGLQLVLAVWIYSILKCEKGNAATAAVQLFSYNH